MIDNNNRYCIFCSTPYTYVDKRTGKQQWYKVPNKSRGWMCKKCKDKTRDYSYAAIIKNRQCEKCGKKTGDIHEQGLPVRVEQIPDKLRYVRFVCTVCNLQDAMASVYGTVLQNLGKYRQVK